VTDVAVHPVSGRIYVLDAALRSVAVFERDGTPAFTFGQRGRGPGDYEAPSRIMVLPWSGDLAVWDAALQRLTVSSVTGAVKATHLLAHERSSVGLDNELSQTGRTIAARVDGYVFEVRSNPAQVVAAQQKGYLVRLNRDVTVADTLLEFAVSQIGYAARRSANTTHEEWERPLIFSPKPHWAVLTDGGLVVTVGGRYELLHVAADGEPRQRFVRHVPPARVTRDDRLRFLRQEVENRRAGGPLILLERFARDRFALLRPALAGVLAGSANSSWIRRFDTAEDPEGRSGTFDVVSAEEELIAQYQFPEGANPLFIDGESVYAAVKDSAGAESLAVFRMPTAASARPPLVPRGVAEAQLSRQR